jgi:hypothetical protein
VKLETPNLDRLRSYLDPIVDRFEQVDFIKDDPISIPHGFENPADQSIIGLFAALLAWGRRDIMLAKLVQLCERMDYKPAEFVIQPPLADPNWTVLCTERSMRTTLRDSLFHFRPF